MPRTIRPLLEEFDPGVPRGSRANPAAKSLCLRIADARTVVPFRGSAPALNELIAGNVELTIDNMSTVRPQVKQGTLRALGVASLTRTPLVPDVPAIAETVPGFEVTSWVGVVAPAGTPPAIVAKISKDFADAVNQPGILKRLEEFGATSATDSPSEFAEAVIQNW